MRKVSILAALTVFALAGLARAQEAPAAAPPPDPGAAPAPEMAPAAPAEAAPATAAPASGRLIIGADAAFQLPLGNFADATGIGIGALVRGEFNIIPKLNLTFRTGYIYSLDKDGFSVSNIPAWVGGKYFITDMIYGAAEIGENILISKIPDVEVFGVTVGGGSSTDYKFGATVGAGVLLGPLDIKAQFEILSLGDASDSMALMVNVGYNFVKLL
jgi:hypothetical protein